MKKALLVIVFLGILILDWLALDDITTGNQPSYYWEYGMLFLSILIMIMLYMLLRRDKRLT